MEQSFIAVYDACVLYPVFLRDFLIRLAGHGQREGAFSAKWTGRIHREWIRAVRRNNPSIELRALQRTRRLMDVHIRGCRVRGYQRWEPRLTLPDPNDRHVLAAAMACIADVIVTFNTRDFPETVLRVVGMTAVDPDAFTMQFRRSGIVVAAAAEHRASLHRPPLSVAEYLEALRRNRMGATAAFLAADHSGQF